MNNNNQYNHLNDHIKHEHNIISNQLVNSGNGNNNIQIDDQSNYFLQNRHMFMPNQHQERQHHIEHHPIQMINTNDCNSENLHYQQHKMDNDKQHFYNNNQNININKNNSNDNQLVKIEINESSNTQYKPNKRDLELELEKTQQNENKSSIIDCVYDQKTVVGNSLVKNDKSDDNEDPIENTVLKNSDVNIESNDYEKYEQSELEQDSENIQSRGSNSDSELSDKKNENYSVYKKFKINENQLSNGKLMDSNDNFVRKEILVEEKSENNLVLQSHIMESNKNDASS